jgi:hypothetical protein
MILRFEAQQVDSGIYSVRMVPGGYTKPLSIFFEVDLEGINTIENSPELSKLMSAAFNAGAKLSR